ELDRGDQGRVGRPGRRDRCRRKHRGRGRRVRDHRGGVLAMIITRTPLRISLGGGGTDLPSFYESNDGGFLVAAAISQYIYIAIHRNFDDDLLLKYSAVERVPSPSEIRHPLLREAFTMIGPSRGVELTSMADIPAGTGLGSSGSFTVGVLKALHSYQRLPV